MSTVETSVKVIPLGGLEQIGMNMTVFEYGESIIVVDCGMSFPGDEMLGIDMVIPDITYLKQNIHKVKGVFITHGHEDHIGALPFFFKEINVPLYGTKLTLGIIEGKLEEHGITKSVKRKVVKYGQTISAGDFKAAICGLSWTTCTSNGAARPWAGRAARGRGCTTPKRAWCACPTRRTACCSRRR